MANKIVGVFASEQEATRAIEELQSRGVPTDEISVITRDRDDMRNISEDTGTLAPEGVATGAATGGVVGGVAGLLAGIGALAIPGIGPILAAGPIVATLTGAAIGAGAGGLVGGLIGLGIPEDEAREYESFVDRGDILVLVEESGNGRAIHDVFRNFGSLNTDRYNTVYPDIPPVDRGSVTTEQPMGSGTLNSRGTVDPTVDPEFYNRNRL
ncbi:general stress protein [Paenibacillus tengchongensis]|uniref:general stress protein n=1 Tax=Paenibacillus tengchongensis TaxID=2608684 RepID=UPI00124D4DC8|nr:general stress protein [Paenibacillus tengchongensis]